MKVAYTEEQRQHTIKTFKRLKSYTKTIRALGYSSLHTLHDWVGKRSHKNPSNNPHRSPKHYPWILKLQAVKRANQGEKIRDIAQGLSIISYLSIYKWLCLWRIEGVRCLMKEENIKVCYATRRKNLRAILEKLHLP